MKIGITTFGGDGGKSGISQYIINILREFSSLKERPDFEVMVYEDEKELFVPDPDRMSILGFGGFLRSPVVNVAWHQVALSKWCRKREYDVLFLPAGNRRLPLSVSCPTVGTVHDFSSIHVEGKYDPARMFYIKQVLPFLIRRLTLVLTVSESSKRDIVEYAGVPEERVTVTPLAADDQLYFPGNKEASAESMCSKYGIRTPYILYISRIEHPGKNHAGLIRAFSRLKAGGDIPHQLVLAGSDWDRAEEVHRIANESQYADDIVFTGFAPTGDMPDLYRGADLFVFPSLYEGFGLPVLEAMSCGVPVACSNISSMPEVAGDTGMLFDPYDEESISESIRRLLTDTDLLNDYGRRGLERSKNFTWAATAARTLEVIRKAAGEGA
ncbi:MAG: glycosyltransferase family 1 protein [Thermodesulfobacteriota bacterium]|nr:glycosyltransferase family 1 protein [Thermodesulfobacteriota bacterium]